MRVVVTGAAGFVGSHLAEALVAEGHDVTGIDCLTPYYDPALKRANLDALVGHPGFVFSDVDLRTASLAHLLAGADVVCHLAAQPGVTSPAAPCRAMNVVATRRLLRASSRAGVRRVVFASSSTVYGDVAGPVSEDGPLRPRSAYGASKVAAEELCAEAARSGSTEVVVLRYFSVYGPRQRPDMAVHRFVEALLDGRPVEVFGSGRQARDVTYVGDAVAATLAAATVPGLPSYSAMNVAGGTVTPVSDLVHRLAALTGRASGIRHRPARPEDVECTWASTEAARRWLGWQPSVDLEAGLRAQIGWHVGRRDRVGRVTAAQ